ICPDCMRQASVGFQCPDCVKRGATQSRSVRTVYGGRVASGSNVVTISLIAINVLVWIVAVATGGVDGKFARTLILLPQGGPTRLSNGQVVIVDGVADGSYWQLVTSTFLHTQPLHILLNMVGLWIFGSFLEVALGRWRYLLLYLLSGLAGSVAIYWLAPPGSFSLGASGAVFGLFGASLVILLRQHRDVTQLLILLGLNLVFSFTASNVSWQAHVGGLVAGLVMGAGFAYTPRSQRTPIHAGMLIGVGVVLVLAALARTAALT
ncbi:MAG TPA: rhomboid family intramembrane serine protease, partial [Nocardioidaceae bacterium]